MKPTIAITAGDTNGIGYEVIVKALADPHMNEICTPVVYGNSEVLKVHLQRMDEEMRNVKLNIVKCYEDDVPVQFGEPTEASGKAALASLEMAVKDLKAGKVQAIVTAPISKAAIHSEAFPFAGHTEYFGSHFAEPGREGLMMMINDRMKVALVCNHVPISRVPQLISEDRVLRKIRVLHETLQTDFLLRAPRIAVLGLNPHAGENGLIGNEEKDSIKPAVQKACEEGILAFGPYSADGFFGTGEYVHFDAILGMYHDQVLTPFKIVNMDGVNFTAGLPIVRVSPDHGTAYDKAGKNRAEEASMRAAVYFAIDTLKNRQLSREINSNPLR